MKHLIIIVSLVFWNFTVSSQTDPKAQDILKGVSAKYRSYKSLVASFKLNLLDKKTGKSQTQAGTVTIKGEMFHLAMADQEVGNDGKVMWTWLKESNEVQLSEAEVNPDAISPTNIFTMYEKGFKTKYAGDKTVEGKAVQQVELYPEDNKKNYFKIVINILKKDKYVNSAKVFDKNGNIYTYSIVKFTPNAEVSDSLFSFNKGKYPGAEIVDLR